MWNIEHGKNVEHRIQEYHSSTTETITTGGNKRHNKVTFIKNNRLHKSHRTHFHCNFVPCTTKLQEDR
jgi:hypothetical protein